MEVLFCLVFDHDYGRALSLMGAFGAGNALWVFEQPDADTPAREIVAFYTGISARIVAGASLSLVGGAVFVLFASRVRVTLREHEGDDWGRLRPMARAQPLWSANSQRTPSLPRRAHA